MTDMIRTFLNTCIKDMNLLRIHAVYLVVLTLTSCYNQASDTPDAWNLTDQQIDSISFSTTHHYSQNYNFIVKGDSIVLICQRPNETAYDSITIYHNNRIVVADILTLPEDTTDSVWVKVARDQTTQGWVHEKELLKNVEPDDPISQFISTFSDVHLLIFLALLVITCAIYGLVKLSKRNAHIVHFNDIDSFYPTLLALNIAFSATLYASIQMFGADSWRHFYYHPSLNPFTLPPHLGLFITSVWSMIIILIAVIDELRRILTFGDAILYLSGLAATCAVNYVVFSITTLYYIGYILFIAYCIFAIHRYLHNSHSTYLCGRCGAKLMRKGKCPQCGTINE